MTDIHDLHAFVCAADNRQTGDPDWTRRRNELLHVERQDGASHGLWWLSFVDPTVDVPPGERTPGGRSFLGACWVEAAGPIDAVDKTFDLKINPGGDVALWGPFPVAHASVAWRAAWCDRLLTFPETEAIPEMDQLPIDQLP